MQRRLGFENRLAYESYMSRISRLVPVRGQVLEPYRAQERKRLCEMHGSYGLRGIVVSTHALEAEHGVSFGEV